MKHDYRRYVVEFVANRKGLYAIETALERPEECGASEPHDVLFGEIISSKRFNLRAYNRSEGFEDDAFYEE